MGEGVLTKMCRKKAKPRQVSHDRERVEEEREGVHVSKFETGMTCNDFLFFLLVLFI